MLIGVDYLDQNGSVCYFCGQELIPIKVSHKEYTDSGRVKAKIHQCTCNHGHICFIKIYNNDTNFNLVMQCHMFVFLDDCLDHGMKELECTVIYNQIINYLPLTGDFSYGKTKNKNI